MELRYGILSTSSIAPRFIAGVRESGKGQIVALSSRTLEKAKEKAALWEIPTAYGSHEELLLDENVNIVYISNVNSAHYLWAKAALLAGKHVVCEKPCTTAAQQTAELYDLAESKGLFFMEAQKMLFLPAVLEAKKLLPRLGKITMIELSHSFPGSYNGWMFDKAAGGGPLLSSGIYVTELITWLFGNIESIQGSACKDEKGVEWQYILTGKTQCGVQFCAQNSTKVTLPNTCRIYGEQGYIELPSYWKAQKLILHNHGQTQVLEFPCQYELMYEASHIYNCLQQGLLRSPVITKELSIAGIRALERVKSSW